uniref:Uncharacterized protein n=1 Tax=Oryza punctata TaxID=4537 RepID=A0A0E0MMW4_ORYPU
MGNDAATSRRRRHGRQAPGRRARDGWRQPAVGEREGGGRPSGVMKLVGRSGVAGRAREETTREVGKVATGGGAAREASRTAAGGVGGGRTRRRSGDVRSQQIGEATSSISGLRSPAWAISTTPNSSSIPRAGSESTPRAKTRSSFSGNFQELLVLVKKREVAALPFHGCAEASRVAQNTNLSPKCNPRV